MRKRDRRRRRSSRRPGCRARPRTPRRTACAPTSAHERFVHTSTRCVADGLEVEHVVERRDRMAVGGRQLERVGDLADRLGREPAVLLLREPQRRDRRRARALGEAVAQRPAIRVEERRAHRSTSPMTVSSEPTIAIMSATSASRHAGRGRLQRDERRRPELHAPRPRAAVGDDVAAELAARRLDRDVHLALGDAVALGDDLEVVDQRLHRGVELLARRQHDLAVVRDPRLALHAPRACRGTAAMIFVDSRISSMCTR